LGSSSKLNSGPSLVEAITAIDKETDQSPESYLINCSHPLEYEPAIEPGAGRECQRSYVKENSAANRHRNPLVNDRF